MSQPTAPVSPGFPPVAPQPGFDAIAGGTRLVAPASLPASARTPLALKHYLWIAGGLVVLYFALTRLGPVLTPFLIGAILAYLGTPLVNALERRGVHRGLGTTITVLLFGIALLGLFLVLVPLVQAEVTLVMKRMPELFTIASERLLPWLERVFGITVALDFATIREVLADNLESVRDGRPSSARRREVGRHAAVVDPHQPRAHSGGDVLPAARLEQDRRAHR